MRLRLAIVYLAALSSLGRPAPAQAPAAPAASAPSAQDRATARLLAEEADKKLEAGDARGALELFQRADAIFPAPTLKLAIARSMARLGQIIEAHELLLDVARSEPQKGEPASWTTARESARQEAEALAPRVPKIEISIEGLDSTSTLRVTLDGHRIPNESLGVTRPINPGQHRVRAEADGYMPAEQKIQMGEGEHYRLTLKMFAEPTAAAPSSSSSRAPPRPGVKPGKPDKGKEPQPIDDAKGSKTLAIIGFSSAGAFAITGSILGWMVSSRVDEIRKDCTLPPGDVCPLSRRPDADRASNLATGANISFALAAIGLGVGVYGLFSGADAKSSGQASRVRVGVGPASVGVAGSF